MGLLEGLVIHKLKEGEEKIEIQGRIFLGHHLLSRLQIIQTQTKVCISKKEFEFVLAQNRRK